MDETLFPAVILAGGIATRLRPLTESVPKALVEIAGQPFLSHQLRLLKSRGIETIVLCTGYRSDMIQQYVGDGSRWGVRASYSPDGPSLLGTAGAIRKALSMLGPSFFVLYGDSYLECDYRAVQQAFQTARKPALMTVFRNEGRFDSSNVEFEEGNILAYDKQQQTARMKHIDYGLGIFEACVFQQKVPAGVPYDLAFLYKELLAEGNLAGNEVPERFYEIGSFQGIQELGTYLSGRGPV